MENTQIQYQARYKISHLILEQSEIKSNNDEKRKPNMYEK